MSLYSAKVHMVPGGDILEVEDGGSIEIESSSGIVIETGGEINIEDGGHIQVQSSSGLVVETGGEINVEDGGKIVIEDGGQILDPVASSTSATVNVLKNYGISTVVSSSVDKKYTILHPVAGVLKTIVRLPTTTDHPVVGSTANDVLFTSSAASQFLTFTSDLYAAVQMIGLSSTRWAIIRQTSNVTVDDAGGGT